MKQIKKPAIRIFLLIPALLFAAACATTTPVLEKDDKTAPQSVVFPEYTGPKIPLAVLPLGLSERAVKRYPHLLEQSVGLGMHNTLTDALYKTKRFRFVEDKESVIQEALKRQRMGATGLVDAAHAVEIGKLLGAEKVIYGEVYDYAEGKIETLKGISKSVTPKIRVGVQIRLVDLETLEYIPASCIRYGSDWGRAAQSAIEAAVFQIVSGME